MRSLTLVLGTCALLLASPPAGGAQDGVVRAVLFYSPTCPHCHQVINNDLPPLRQKYGDRLVIAGVDVSTPAGSALYDAMVAYFALPQERLGVPALVVGTTVLVGSYEIPQQFPEIIERGLAGGGIYWPPVNELRQALEAGGMIQRRSAPQTPQAPAPAPSDTAGARTRPAAGAPVPAPEPPPPADTGRTRSPASPPAEGVAPPEAHVERGGPAPTTPTPPAGVLTLSVTDSVLALERGGPVALFLRDPVGNGMSVAVLLGLLGVLGWSMAVMMRPGARVSAPPAWLFPALGIVGAGVAGYLSFVEVTGATAVCGPVGDCNTVQQSEWARLFGVLPVGVLGLAGYAALLAAWAVGTWGPETLARRAWTAAWAMALVGTAFSAYLTFLEPFVIGATCAWCLTSAVVMALMLVAATGRAAAPLPPA